MNSTTRRRKEIQFQSHYFKVKLEENQLLLESSLPLPLPLPQVHPFLLLSLFLPNHNALHQPSSLHINDRSPRVSFRLLLLLRQTHVSCRNCEESILLKTSSVLILDPESLQQLFPTLTTSHLQSLSPLLRIPPPQVQGIEDHLHHDSISIYSTSTILLLPLLLRLTLLMPLRTEEEEEG